MNCPVEMTDYQSALIGADWYEECGRQDIAEQIRELSVYRSDRTSNFIRVRIKLSFSKTRESNIKKYSTSHSSFRYEKALSLCSSLSDRPHYGKFHSYCRSGEQRNDTSDLSDSTY